MTNSRVENSALVTIVVTPRERFGLSERSLESILANTKIPHNLIYVSTGRNDRVETYLSYASKAHKFILITGVGYRSPNYYKNLALREVQTKYVIFIDNDTVVSPGWDEALLRCAEETQAAVVGPVILWGAMGDPIIHMAGGTISKRMENGTTVLYEDHDFKNESILSTCSILKRRRSDTTEFHCMLVRTDFLQSVGPLDEELMSINEHIDINLLAKQQNELTFIEPSSIVTYLTSPGLETTDALYYLLRWSETWNRASLDRFNKKWAVRFADSEGVWGRRHRRLVHGAVYPAGPLCGGPATCYENAELMLAAFLSHDVYHFNISIIDPINNSVVDSQHLDAIGLTDALPHYLCMKDGKNILVSPCYPEKHFEGSSGIIFLKFGSLLEDSVRKLETASFLTIEVYPGRFDVWLALQEEYRDLVDQLKSLMQASTDLASIPMESSAFVGVPHQYQRVDGSMHSFIPKIRSINLGVIMEPDFLLQQFGHL